MIMYKKIIATGVLAIAAISVLVASDATAGSPPVLSVSVGGEFVTFNGTSGYTPGGNVWIGLSLNGTQQCIWNTTGRLNGTIYAVEGVPYESCGCGVTYTGWSLDWGSEQASNNVGNVYIDCPQ
jgi:hypothetical protein